jgi:tRNA threonylcarbamoyladenosine biosynthesis protein TsaE
MRRTVHRVPDPESMTALGQEVAVRLRAGDVVLVTGPLGAGKTTFTQGVARGLDVVGPVTSPTFVIAREHDSNTDGPRLVHVDAYRLGGLAELDDLDLETSLNDAVTVVEWGGGLVEHLDAPLVSVTIDRDAEGDERTVVVQWPERGR